ncbi:hypothetical protein B0A69_14595 [Chryseobacterium shigense]|uniref:Uncharacterized protein n=1 Tax=Chryseobacterium shigense TaxID=297244 RepID=A0A1N7IY45_9FLAO|nr:hypothetical protein [Chryseobacterium shigense]PQA92276.1 hypothetical protein B0A69_14595 [Chryseobacterium shigense]SIS41927.1 hypothetical protein SAMN05421639_104737 [Chryseobacterium shigense]
MMTATQEIEIKQYLISKKLDHELLLEIKDHFILQITHLMEDHNISFQEAFLQTQMNWKYELEMVRADILSVRKVSRIEKHILQNRFRKMTGYALLSSVLFLILLYTEPDLYNEVQMVAFAIIFGLAGYNFIFRKMKLYHYTQISFHPLLLKNLFVGLVVMGCTSFFFQDFRMVASVIIKPFFLFATAVQIQLLYWNAKKVNVLI